MTATATATDPTLLDFFDYYLGHFATLAAERNAAERVTLIYNPDTFATLVEAANALNAAGRTIYVVADHGRLFADVFPQGAEVAPGYRYRRAEILAAP